MNANQVLTEIQPYLTYDTILLFSSDEHSPSSVFQRDSIHDSMNHASEMKVFPTIYHDENINTLSSQLRLTLPISTLSLQDVVIESEKCLSSVCAFNDHTPNGFKVPLHGTKEEALLMKQLHDTLTKVTNYSTLYTYIGLGDIYRCRSLVL
jgi:hypothetical protein